jgi:hypothetical protein
VIPTVTGAAAGARRGPDDVANLSSGGAGLRTYTRSLTNAQIISAVERWQAEPHMRPLCCTSTCPDRPLVPKEVHGQVILECPDCNYYTTFISDEVLLWDGTAF